MSEEQGQVDTFLNSLSKLLQDKLREDRQRQRQLEREVAELRSRSQLPQKNQRLVSADDAELAGRPSESLGLPPKLAFNRLVPARKPPALAEDDDSSGDDDDDEHAPPLPKRRSTPPLPQRRRDKTPPLPQRRHNKTPPLSERRNNKTPPLPERKHNKTPPLPERRHNKTPPLPKRKDNRTPPLPRRKPSLGVRNRAELQDVDSDEDAPPLPRRRALMNHVGESTRIESDDEGPPLPRRPDTDKRVPPAKPKRKTPPQEGFPEYDNYVMSPSKADNHHPEEESKSLGIGNPRFKGASLLSQWQPPKQAVGEPPAPPAPRKRPPQQFVDMEREISEQKVTVALVGKSVSRSTADATLIRSSSGSIVLGDSEESLPLKPPKPSLSDRVSPVEERPELISSDESEQHPPPIKAPKPKVAKSTNPLKLWKPPIKLTEVPPQPVDDFEAENYDDNRGRAPEKPARKGWMNSLSANSKTERHTQVNVLPTRSPSKLSWMLLLQANPKTERHVQLSTSPVRSPSKLSWMALLSSNSATTAHRQSSQAAVPTSPAKISRSPTRTDWLSLATSKSASLTTAHGESEMTRSVSRSPTKLSWIDLALSRGTDAHQYTDNTKPNFEIKKLARAKDIVVEDDDKKVPEFLNAKLKRSPEKPTVPPKATPEEVPVVSQLQKLKATKPPPRKPPKPSDNEDEELLASTMEKLGKKKLPPPKAAKPSPADNEPAILAEKLRSLSPSKTDTPSKPKDSKYLEADAAELRLQMLRLGRSTTTKQAPKPEAQPVEAIATLSKLKAAPPVKPKPKETPEALAKLGALKHPQPLPRKAPVEVEEPDFKAQLGNILKRGAPPSGGLSDGRKSPSDLTPVSVMSAVLLNSLQLSIGLSSSLKRSDTVSSGKLQHATKLRAKGPKRRLPKLSTSESLNEKGSARGTPLRKVSTDSKLDKKAPPLPVKKKPTVESRQFSGEVFI